MSKHTKGPWYLVAEDDCDFTAISRKPKLPKDSQLDLDNEVLGSSEYLRVTPEDLRLMAAAPELLAALKGLLKEETLEWQNPKFRAVSTRRTRKALAAIAKAEGRE